MLVAHYTNCLTVIAHLGQSEWNFKPKHHLELLAQVRKTLVNYNVEDDAIVDVVYSFRSTTDSTVPISYYFSFPATGNPWINLSAWGHYFSLLPLDLVLPEWIRRHFNSLLQGLPKFRFEEIQRMVIQLLRPVLKPGYFQVVKPPPRNRYSRFHPTERDFFELKGFWNDSCNPLWLLRMLSASRVKTTGHSVRQILAQPYLDWLFETAYKDQIGGLRFWASDPSLFVKFKQQFSSTKPRVRGLFKPKTIKEKYYYFLEKENELILTTFLTLALDIPINLAVLVARPRPWLFKHRATEPTGS